MMMTTDRIGLRMEHNWDMACQGGETTIPGDVSESVCWDDTITERERERDSNSNNIITDIHSHIHTECAMFIFVLPNWVELNNHRVCLLYRLSCQSCREWEFILQFSLSASWAATLIVCRLCFSFSVACGGKKYLKHPSTCFVGPRAWAIAITNPQNWKCLAKPISTKLPKRWRRMYNKYPTMV